MKTDTEIQTVLMAEYRFDALLDAGENNNDIKNVIAAASAKVDVYGKKTDSERGAKTVIGMNASAESIDSRIAGPGKENDETIAHTILNKLQWQTLISDEKIKVKIENNWVTLEGAVEWEFQLNPAKTQYVFAL